MNDPQDALKTPPVVYNLTGTVAGRFAIQGQLGAGGMGQVYRAADETLKRTVAIKRMAPQFQFDPRDRQRFLREAQRASGLNHPNIAAIYDVLEDKGEILLVMEFIEGVTLRQRMKQAMGLAEFLEIAIQCADGLGAAHESRIVHGDIKPENIMLTPAKRVKVLDFGVARRFTSATANEATQSMASMTAAICGTPAYMAPEVLKQRPYDGRADLFSLGLTFYEMLGGKQPFQSDSFAGTLAQVLHAEVPSLSEVNKRVPLPIANVVSKLLMKDPEARYANAKALLDDLQLLQQGGKPKFTPVDQKVRRPQSWMKWAAVVVGAVALVAAFRGPLGRLIAIDTATGARPDSAPVALPQRQILALLPFPAIEGDPKLTSLGQGLVESVSAKLSHLTEDRPLEVIPASNLQARNVNSVAEASKQFGATLGLAVTLSKSGELLHVTYSLLDAHSGRAVGGDAITVPAADAFTIEDDVARGAVKALQLKLQPEEQAALNVHGTDQAAAFAYFLQARGYLLDFVKAENIENALIMTREALKLDPNFGMARATLGEAYWRKYWLTKDAQWAKLAKNECASAVKLGNSGAAGHTCLGLVNDGTGEYKEAAAEFQRAVELEPTNEDAYVGLALAYEHQGAISESEKTYQRAIDSHPTSSHAYNSLGTFYLRRNEYEKAAGMFQKVIELAPEGYGGYVNLGATYNDMGKYKDAIEPLKKSIAIRPSYAAYTNLSTAYFGLNQFAEDAASNEEAIKLNPEQHIVWGNLGDARKYLGQKKEASETYQRAAELALKELKVNPRDPDVLSSLANYYSELGDRNRALLYLGQSLQYGRNDKEILLDAAEVHNNLGESGLAVEWLGKAVRAGYPVERIASLPEFRNLEYNPGYRQLTLRTPVSK